MSAAAQGLNEAYLQQPHQGPFYGKAPFHRERERQPGLTNWPTNETPRKPPQREGALILEIGQGKTLLELTRSHIERDIEQLRKFYVFSDSPVIEQFLTDHQPLPSVLLAAVEPLKNSFGDDSVFRLEVTTDQDDSRMLYAVALWRGNVRTAAQALDNFAENWWLDHMTPNTAELAFIFRISR